MNELYAFIIILITILTLVLIIESPQININIPEKRNQTNAEIIDCAYNPSPVCRAPLNQDPFMNLLNKPYRSETNIGVFEP